MENVVRIEDIPAFVERTIVAVRDGIALVRKTGVLAELPKEIQFDMTVIGLWQSPDLAVVTTDSSTGSDTGSSTTTQTGIGTVVSHDESEGNGTSASASAGHMRGYIRARHDALARELRCGKQLASEVHAAPQARKILRRFIAHARRLQHAPVS